MEGLQEEEDSYLIRNLVMADRLGVEPFINIKMRAWELYQSSISRLFELISRKGYKVYNFEQKYLEILRDMALEKNYHVLLDEFYILNDLDKVHLGIKDVVVSFIEIVGIEHIGDFRYLCFLNSFLIKKGLITDHYDIIDLYNLVKEEAKDYDIKRLERELFSHEEILSKSYNIDDIDRMEGIEFERFLVKLLGKNGFRVEITKTSGDQGVDLIAYKRNRKYAIQAKRYRDKVGNKAIQEVVAGQKYYNADKSWVITNSTFTKAAIDLAKRNNTLLWDRSKLLIMLDLMNE